MKISNNTNIYIVGTVFSVTAPMISTVHCLSEHHKQPSVLPQTMFCPFCSAGGLGSLSFFHLLVLSYVCFDHPSPLAMVAYSSSVLPSICTCKAEEMWHHSCSSFDLCHFEFISFASTKQPEFSLLGSSIFLCVCACAHVRLKVMVDFW